MKDEISGLMMVHGRYAIPSMGQDVDLATMGMGGLNLSEDSKIMEVRGEGKKKKCSPTLKTGVKTPRGRGRRNTPKRVDPKQKLLPEMIRGKGGKEKVGESGSGTHM